MKRTARTIYNLVVPLLIVLLCVGAWECAGSPKSQCHDGDFRTRTERHHRVYEQCSNGEWIPATAPTPR